MRDADLLILDEPTASLDVRSEYEVFQAFDELTAGKMAVVKLMSLPAFTTGVRLPLFSWPGEGMLKLARQFAGSFP